MSLPTRATNLRRKIGTELAKHDVTLDIVLEIDDTPARLELAALEQLQRSRRAVRLRLVPICVRSLSPGGR